MPRPHVANVSTKKSRKGYLARFASNTSFISASVEDSFEAFSSCCRWCVIMWAMILVWNSVSLKVSLRS